jgi:hypothetical protein
MKIFNPEDPQNISWYPFMEEKYDKTHFSKSKINRQTQDFKLYKINGDKLLHFSVESYKLFHDLYIFKQDR